MNVIAVRKMTVLCKQFKHLEVIVIPFFIYHSECCIFLDLHIETIELLILLLELVKVTCRYTKLFLSLSLSHLNNKNCSIVLNTTAYFNNVNNISWVLVSVFLICVCRYLYTYLQLMPTVIVHLSRKWYIIHPWIPRN